MSLIGNIKEKLLKIITLFLIIFLFVWIYFYSDHFIIFWSNFGKGIGFMLKDFGSSVLNAFSQLPNTLKSVPQAMLETIKELPSTLADFPQAIIKSLKAIKNLTLTFLGIENNGINWWNCMKTAMIAGTATVVIAPCVGLIGVTGLMCAGLFGFSAGFLVNYIQQQYFQKETNTIKSNYSINLGTSINLTTEQIETINNHPLVKKNFSAYKHILTTIDKNNQAIYEIINVEIKIEKANEILEKLKNLQIKYQNEKNSFNSELINNIPVLKQITQDVENQIQQQITNLEIIINQQFNK